MHARGRCVRRVEGFYPYCIIENKLLANSPGLPRTWQGEHRWQGGFALSWICSLKHLGLLGGFLCCVLGIRVEGCMRVPENCRAFRSFGVIAFGLDGP